MTPTVEQKLTAKELAAALGMSLSTVYRLKLNGQLPYLQLGGKNHLVRFPASILELTTLPLPVSSKISTSEKPISGPRPKWLTESQDQ